MKRYILCICMLLVMCCIGCNIEDIKNNATESISINVSELEDEVGKSGHEADFEEEIIVSTRVADVGVDDKTEAINSRYAKKYYRGHWLSERGIIYAPNVVLFSNIDFEPLVLVTLDEGEKIVCCSCVGCKHFIATNCLENAYSKTPECRAVLYRNAYETAYYEGNIYFFVGGKIVRMDIDEGERIIIADLPFEMCKDYARSVVFSGDYIYYNMMRSIGFRKYEYGIVEVSLLDGSYRYLTEINAGVQEFDIAGNTMYTTILDTETSQLKK